MTANAIPCATCRTKPEGGEFLLQDLRRPFSSNPSRNLTRTFVADILRTRQHGAMKEFSRLSEPNFLLWRGDGNGNGNGISAGIQSAINLIKEKPR